MTLQLTTGPSVSRSNIPIRLQRIQPYPLFGGDARHPWEITAFNPCVIYDPKIGKYHMVYRGAPEPRLIPGEYISVVCHAVSDDGIHWQRCDRPLLVPDLPCENALGAEDPSWTYLDGVYYLYYTAVGGLGQQEVDIRIALATSTDGRRWTKHGVVGPAARSKSAVLFPAKIGGDYAVLYTLHSEMPQSSILLARFRSHAELIRPPAGCMDANAADYCENLVLGPTSSAVRKGPEVGAQPVWTPHGWLLIFCPEHAESIDEWSISAALLDLEDPRRVIAQLQQPLLKAELPLEDGHICRRCVFPRGAVLIGKRLYVYIGTGDDGCGLAVCDYERLMAGLMG